MKLVSFGQKLCSFGCLIVGALFVIFASLVASENTGTTTLEWYIACLGGGVAAFLAMYFSLDKSKKMYAILLVLIAVIAWTILMYLGQYDGSENSAAFSNLVTLSAPTWLAFVVFSIILWVSTKIHTSEYRNEFNGLKRIGTTYQPIIYMYNPETVVSGTGIKQIVKPDIFGILVLLYGLVLVMCNVILNGGTGNIVGFALFAVYGAYILFSEKDYTNWGRFKYVHRFILVFGLAYVIRGILGGGEIDRITSIIEGVILILLASYMSAKVYRMASGTRHPFVSRLLYTLVWFIVVLLLIFFVIGAPIEIVSQFNESDLATGIANVASGVVTFIIMAIVLLYFLLYCRPKQMYYEVDENEDLIRSADYFNENVEEYTVGDAIRDSRIEKKRVREEQYAAYEAQKRADDARRRQAEEIADSISNAAGYGVISVDDREKIISEVMNSSDLATASEVVDRLSGSGVESIKDNAEDIKRKIR